MLKPSSLKPGSSAAAALALAAALTIGSAALAADAKYPSWPGQRRRVVVPGVGGQGAFDQTRLWGRGQQAPLTAEYQKVFEASLADQAKGGLGNYPSSRCLPSGMPRMMYFGAQEYIIEPGVTHILVGGGVDHTRRIFTDGRDWPAEIEPTLTGYSIGRWIDENNDGRYDVLEVETRGPFKGPRHYDAAGLPLHHDNQSIFKERFYLDKSEKNLLHDEITVVDHALTRPWTVTRDFRRNPNPRPDWGEFVCAEGNAYVTIDKETYFLSADGLLMPMKKGQTPPDLRYFR